MSDQINFRVRKSKRKKYIRKKRKTYRKKSKTYRKKRKTYRKNTKHRVKQEGGNGSHRIGLELEACFKGDHEIWIHDGQEDVFEQCKGSPEWGDESQVPVKGDNPLVNLFGAELKYFNAVHEPHISCSPSWPVSMEKARQDAPAFKSGDKVLTDRETQGTVIDGTIDANGKIQVAFVPEESGYDGTFPYRPAALTHLAHRSVVEKSDPCSMELVLSEAHSFTYDDKQIYMDGKDITLNLLDEILLISSKAESCWGDSCAFHVHISETDKKYSLDRPEGKIFLLHVLALWCGIEGGPPGEQTTFIEKGYIRDDSLYARLMEPLDPGDFKLVYDKAKNRNLNNQELVEYLIENPLLVDRAGLRWGARRFFTLNIYFLGISEETTAAALDLSEPLRIEFRGHKGLMKTIMDKPEMTQYDQSSIDAITTMHKNFNPENIRNRALSSRFFNYLMEYLEDIDLFFTKAKKYEPNLS